LKQQLKYILERNNIFLKKVENILNNCSPKELIKDDEKENIVISEIDCTYNS
jgi:hypothetical protein